MAVRLLLLAGRPSFFFRSFFLDRIPTMGQTMPKYASEEEPGTDGDKDTLATWKEELLKTNDLDLEKNDIRSSLIDVGRSLIEIDSGERKKKQNKQHERIRVRGSSSFLQIQLILYVLLQEKNSYFVVKERDQVDLATGKIVNVILLLVCKDQALTNILNYYDVFQSGTSLNIIIIIIFINTFSPPSYQSPNRDGRGVRISREDHNVSCIRSRKLGYAVTAAAC